MPDSYTDTASTNGARHALAESYMAASRSNHKGFLSISAGEEMSLFGFPPEIRLIIWELLLPGRRVLSVRTRVEGGVENARLALEGQPRQPILSQICQESRDFILRRGAFIFKKGLKKGLKKGDNGGFWWSSEDDVFLVDRHCGLPSLSHALQPLAGLDMIQHVAVDSFQAAAIQWYKQEPQGVNTGIAIGSEAAPAVRWLLSWGQVWECPSYKHPILRYFKHCARLTVHFAEPLHHASHSGQSCDLLGDCSLTFDIPTKNMETTIHDIGEFHRKWSSLEGGPDSGGVTFHFRWKPTVFSAIPDSIELCKIPSFRDAEDHVNIQWACSHRILWRLWRRRDRLRSRRQN